MEKGMKRTVKRVLFGAGWVMALTVVFCVLASALVLGGAVGQRQIGLSGLVSVALAVYFGCRIGGRNYSGGKLPLALMQTGVYLIMLLVVNLACFADVPSGGLAVCGVSAAAAILAALTASGHGKGKRHRKR